MQIPLTNGTWAAAVRIAGYFTRLRQGLLVAVFCLATAFLSLGCGDEIDCYNAFDRPPGKLISENGYVFLGTLVSVDTLVHLGKTVRYESEIDNFLVQYAFRPEEDIKASFSDTLVFLWYVATLFPPTGHTSGLPVKLSEQTLVYGNPLDSLPDFLNVMQPRVARSIDVVRDMLAGGELPDRESLINETDLELAQRILNDTALPSRLERAHGLGPVLYGTDFLYGTQESYCKGRLAYCDSTTFRAYAVSSEEYLEALRALRK